MERKTEQLNKNERGVVQKPLEPAVQESESIAAVKEDGANPSSLNKKTERDMPPPGVPVAFY